MIDYEYIKPKLVKLFALDINCLPVFTKSWVCRYDRKYRNELKFQPKPPTLVVKSQTKMKINLKIEPGSSKGPICG